MKPLYMDTTRLRVLGSDPGIRNFGMCMVELIGMSSVIGIEGPRTRTLIPRFVIKHWAIVDLETVPSPYDANQSLNLADLVEPDDGKNMAAWRRGLTAELASNRLTPWNGPYPCNLTACTEFPVLATENQLDALDNIKYRREIAALKNNQHTIKEFLDTAKAKMLDEHVRSALVDFVSDRKITIRDPDEFSRQRMYILTQVLMSAVEAIDLALVRSDPLAPSVSRMIVNHARKFGIPSDGTIPYAMRKQRSIEVARELLTVQSESMEYTEEERVNGKRWLRYLRDLEEKGQKLDDVADAFLVALHMAEEVYCDYYRTARQRPFPRPPVPHCLTPVTNSDIEAQNAGADKDSQIPVNRAPRKLNPAKPSLKRKLEDADDGEDDKPSSPGKPKKASQAKKPAKASRKRKVASSEEDSGDAEEEDVVKPARRRKLKKARKDASAEVDE